MLLHIPTYIWFFIRVTDTVSGYEVIEDPGRWRRRSRVEEW